MEWWKTLYEERFVDADWWSIPPEIVINGQVEYFLKGSQLKPCQKILDLGAGTGRHVSCLTAKGYTAKGIEYSQTLVNKGITLDPSIDLTVGDMRSYDTLDNYNAITYFDTSFGIFDDKTNMDLLKKNYNSLEKDGVVMIDYLNPEYWKNQKETIVLNNYKEKGGKLIRNYIYEEENNKIIDSTKYISASGDVKNYTDQILSIYKPDYLREVLLNIGFSFVSYYGSNGFLYPSVLTSVHKDSAFIQIFAKK